jgi:uncharacterized membrane protein
MLISQSLAVVAFAAVLVISFLSTRRTTETGSRRGKVIVGYLAVGIAVLIAGIWLLPYLW